MKNYQLLCLISTIYLLVYKIDAIPDLNQTSREPVITVPGTDAYLSCKVKNLGSHTVLFRKLDINDSEGEILTVGNFSLRSDNRYQILHERRHDIWLLKIKNVTEEDSGVYICEVNSKPKKKITRLLRIVQESPLISEEPEDGRPPIALYELNHNYTDCCVSNGVPTSCLDYCEFSQLVQSNKQGGSSSFNSRMCFNHINSITKCLTDGRNHLPCCEQHNIPKVCQPICQGNFSLTTVTDYFTCMDYVAPLLACVGKGIKLLPPKPVDLIVEPNNESILVKWTKPLIDFNLINHYQLNVTQLHSFEENGQQVRNLVVSNNQDKFTNENKNTTETPSMFGLQLSYKVNGSLTEFHLFNLKPFTIYEIVMTSRNKFGSSLPTEIIRTVTLANESKPIIPKKNMNTTAIDTSTKPSKEKLPDFKKCCIDNGVPINRCVNVMCDPVRADEATLTDIMICAPWANVTFKCMAQENDHKPCCTARGVPSLCSTFCDGKINKLDFRHFICLKHMSSYQSCILDHYGVLPSEPIDFHVTSVHHNWAILRWKAPSKNQDSIKEYHIYYRESLKDKPSLFNRSISQFAPFLLDGLNANSRYEVYISAVNEYGIGQGSNRVIFFTPAIAYENDEKLVPNYKDIITTKNNLAYNETECCMNAKLAKHCMSLCSYQMKINDVLSLAPKCGDQMSTLVRCGTGGRNHIPCCQRRGVNEGCLNLCAGIVETSPMIIAKTCSSDLGKILKCMEEGTDNIPGMPTDLHAIKVTNSSVQLLWKSAEEDKAKTSITYQVRYGKIDIEKPLHPLEHNQSLNSSYPNAMLNDLEKGSVYSIYVVAANNFGISLPSLVLLVNTTEDSTGLIKSGVGPPHALEVVYQNVDSITFSWLPPLFIPPDTSINYIVNYKTINGTELEYIPTVKDKWIKVETRFNTMIITNLTYNTQYAIGVQAKITYNKIQNDDKNKNRVEISSLSEMILVWTDPAIPASVNLPVTIPSGPILEGQNMTALCVASGNPTPTLSIYINGILAKREEKRHLTYTLVNVQREITSITCYAINGYGNDMQSSQSTLEVKVRFKPSINMMNNDEEITNPINSTARLQCEVSGNPQPQVTWHVQKQGFDVVQFSDNVDIISTPHNEIPFTWINTLLIKRITEENQGKFLCEATNVLGKANKIIDLKIDSTKFNDRNYTDCCEREKVSPKCMKVCHFDIDIQMATTIPECYKDLEKLMFCAADGSDHRQCCRRNQVPAGCVQWCRGSKTRYSNKKEHSSVYCALAASPTIVKCFQEGSSLLPGPVHQLKLTRYTLENNTAQIIWSLPTKNPHLVKYYKVYFRPIGSKNLIISSTNTTTFELSNLDSSKLYEFVVKAGNNMGLSIFSEPLVISYKEYLNLKMSKQASESKWIQSISTFTRIFANLLLVIITIGFVCAGIYVSYNKLSYKIKPPPGSIAFENPSYMKETNTVSFSSGTVDATHMDNLNNNNGEQTDFNENQDDKYSLFK